MEDKFHEGERHVQELVGETVVAKGNSRLISDTIMTGAIGFIEKQLMVVVSSTDKNQNVWSSILLGEHGFIEVPDPNTITLHRDKIHSDKNDIFYENISDGSQIGTLFIELATRRRFRLNGIVSKNADTIQITVQESYPNCPKYIQQRVIHNPDTFQPTSPQKNIGEALTTEIKEWITESDTLFIGSLATSGRMDASHRGGKPGYIEILEDGTLKVPDYMGNSLFNTLGNFAEDSKSGLLFIDFENKKTLQLTGDSTLLFDQTSEEDLAKTGGTGRYWIFKISNWITTNEQHNVNWEFTGYSPFNP